MLEINELSKEDAKMIVKWNEGLDKDFLYQWAGTGYTYPITVEQIGKRLEHSKEEGFMIYKISKEQEMIGTIELFNVDLEHQKATVGRYLLDSACRGKGYGTQVLKQFVEYILRTTELKILGLNVFDFNKGAIKCYNKVGFKQDGESIRPNGWRVIHMVIEKGDVF